MKTIALTGHPMAQQAAHLQLTALLQDRGMDADVKVLVGLTERAEAHGIHDAGGEVWFCGTGVPSPVLASSIDRMLPACSFDDMRIHVITCLAEFVAKTRVGV